MSRLNREQRKKYGSKHPCGTTTKYKDGGCRCSLCRAAIAAYARDYRSRCETYRNPVLRSAVVRKYNLKRNYDLTVEQYDQMYQDQNGVCAICHEKCGSKFRLAVDHDHDTGKVRGLLCLSCNQKLGWYERREDAILSYLVRNKQ